MERGSSNSVFSVGLRDKLQNILLYTWLKVQSWTKVSGQPRKNSITVQKEKTRRFIEKKHHVA